ncbi:MAG: OmpA family protein [Parabacteroides sp.]|nr:OmpA family protein [Parabacteroides sp.]
MKLNRLIQIATLLTSSLFALNAWSAANTYTFETPGKCGPAGNSFAFVVDYSGSMMEAPEDDEESEDYREKQKEELKKQGKEVPLETDQEKEFLETQRMKNAKEILRRLVYMVPNKDAYSGLYSLAPYTAIKAYRDLPKTEDGQKPTIEQLQEYYLEHVKKYKENMEVLGRRTPIGIALFNHGQTMDQNEPKLIGPVVLVTDGRVDRGRKIEEGLDEFYEKNPHSCLHVISFADTEVGIETVKKIAGRKECTKVIQAFDALYDQKKLEQFALDVFYKDCVMSLYGINFAFDKYNIDQKSEKILRDALDFIKSLPTNEKIEINGWTDYMGSDAYNKTLSQNRANAVKKWFIAHGIPADRLIAVGRGKSFLFTNKTAQGRYMNRRMDLRFIQSGVNTEGERTQEQMEY